MLQSYAISYSQLQYDFLHVTQLPKQFLRGVGVGVVGFALGVGAGERVGLGDGLGVASTVGFGVGVGLSLGDGLGVAWTVGLGVGVGLGLGAARVGMSGIGVNLMCYAPQYWKYLSAFYRSALELSTKDT